MEERYDMGSMKEFSIEEFLIQKFQELENRRKRPHNQEKPASSELSEKQSMGVTEIKTQEVNTNNALEESQEISALKEKEFIRLIKEDLYQPENIQEMMNLIWQKRINGRVCDENGDRLLHAAVQKPGLEPLVVALVNEVGSDLTTENDHGDTPIDLAYSKKMQEGLSKYHWKQNHRTILIIDSWIRPNRPDTEEDSQQISPISPLQLSDIVDHANPLPERRVSHQDVKRPSNGQNQNVRE